MYPATGSGELVGAFHVSVTLCAATTPTPVRLTASVGFAAELLVIVSCPVSDPETDGAKTRFTTRLWPGLRVSGSVAPEIEKSVPVTLIAPIVTGWDPIDASVSDCVDVVLMGTLPKLTLVAFTVSIGADGFS